MLNQDSCPTCKDPLAVWQDLRAVYHACGFTAALTLYWKLLTMKKMKGQKMTGWIGRLNVGESTSDVGGL